MKHLGLIAAGAALAVIASTAKVEAQSTFDAVKAKGFVQCGVNTSLPGFSAPDSQGVWRGLDVDMCRAVAAAMFGDANKVRYTPDHRAAALHRAPVGRGRPAGAQHHLDDRARHLARPRLRRGEFL